MSPANSAQQYHFGTRAVHDGSPIDPVTGAVIEPTGAAKPIGKYEYSRSSNPNRLVILTRI
ncbi:hypothetical protein KEM55_000036 [Ascosphaera atra]|nr:hypothetical protein KEM55_000036 [Ascosphaera atra]